MKKVMVLSALSIGILATSCVSKKKYVQLQNEYDNTRSTLTKTQVEKEELQAKYNSIQNRVEAYNTKINSLKDESDAKFETVGDVAVISENQKKQMRKTLQNVDPQKLANAKTLQDSINLAVGYSLTKSMRENFDGNDEDEDIDVNIDETVVMISVSDKLLFNSGSYRVSNKANSLLERLAAVINSEPAIEVMIEGHTDDRTVKQGSYIKDNWDLSTERATAIIRKLADDYNVAPEKMIAAGRSSYKPLVANDSNENRAANRRTRILILPNLDKFFALMSKEG
ncbi:OmpA/MotB family protein [Croceibacter atlanticus]|uniref:OmpA/MotB family protein n=1 Tax=Croceibacter atlanticus TaxID=313588 RepID=UPI0030DCBEE1